MVLDPFDKNDPVSVFSMDPLKRQEWYEDLMTLAKKRKKEMKDKGEKSIETEREHAKIEVFDQEVEK